MKNSFVDLYHWIKGELYDLESFKSSLDCHKDAVNAHLDLAKKLQSAKSDIENVTAGKKTMSTMFKNKDDVGNMQDRVERYERELESQGKLADLLAIYVGRTALP